MFRYTNCTIWTSLSNRKKQIINYIKLKQYKNEGEMIKMLKESIYVWVEELGESEFDSVHKLAKAYFKLWLEHRIDNFGSIQYRGCQLIIRDRDGMNDAVTIESDLKSQVERINEHKDKKDGE